MIFFYIIKNLKISLLNETEKDFYTARVKKLRDLNIRD